MDHLLQWRSDQTAQTYSICLFFPGNLQDFFSRHHDPHIDHLIVIACHHHPYNIFPDIVDIPLDGCKNNFSGGRAFSRCYFIFFKDIWHQTCNCFFHDPGALNHLWKKHFSGAEQVSHVIHSLHQGTFNYSEWLVIILTCFVDIFIDVIKCTLKKSIFQSFVNFHRPPFCFFFIFFPLRLYFFCIMNESVCGIFPAIKNSIFHKFQEVGRDLFIDG